MLNLHIMVLTCKVISRNSFANDILLSARTSHETIFLLESLAQEFAEVSLLLNGDKTVVLTIDAQPPSHLGTHTGIKLQVKNGSRGHTWLGCIVGVGTAGRTTFDTNHHLQVASKKMFANTKTYDPECACE